MNWFKKEREERQKRQNEIFLAELTYRLLRQSLVPVLGCVGGAADCPQLPLTGQDLLPQHTDLLQATVGSHQELRSGNIYQD